MTIDTSWESFHSLAPGFSAAGNVFYSKEYSDLAGAEHCRTVYLRDENRCQVVCIRRIKKLFRFACFPSEPVRTGGESSFEAEQAFLDEAVALLKKTFRLDWISVTQANANFISYPTRSKRIAFGNYIIDLRPGEEQLFAGVSSKHRNMIRRGEKGNVTVRFGGAELLEDYLLADRETWKRSGRNTDNGERYRNILRCLGDSAVIGMAYKDGAPQCGLLGYYNSEMFYYMFGASADSPEPGATHLLQWKNICRMKELGVKKYSFVGCRIRVDENSKLSNIQHFKKGFGGELVQGYAFKCDLRPFKKKLYDLIMKLRTGKIPNDVIDQEIAKWAELN